MRLLLLGGPGGGKGTQGARLAERLEVEHVAAGDALRAEVARGSEIGARVAGYLDVGELVPDDVVVDLMTPIVAAAASAGGYILDGFPRNLAQAEALDVLLTDLDRELDVVFDFQVADRQMLLERLLGRAAEENRTDDTPEAIERRLQIYEEQTAPLVEYYRAKQANVVGVHADRPVADVFAEIREALEQVAARALGSTEAPIHSAPERGSA
jgi:adenylate kinase